MIRCLIVEDEPSSQKVLQYFIKEIPDLELIHTCANAIEALEFVQKASNIDLLFLDIQMPKINGLEFYRSLTQKPAVIFTTAYPEFAIEGFEVNAIDYLLKPFSFDRFLTTIQKYKDKYWSSKSEDFIMIKENKVLHKIFYTQIDYVEAQGDYVKIVTPQKTLLTHSTFNSFLASLPPNFVRIHKSYAVRLESIHSLSSNKVILENTILPLGLTYKSKVYEKFKL